MSPEKSTEIKVQEGSDQGSAPENQENLVILRTKNGNSAVQDCVL